jgi:gas vesicle protein
MRANRRIYRTVLLAVIAIGLISVTGACRKKGPLERLGGKADRAVDEAGQAVKDAADKTKEAAEDAADKTKEAAQDAADKVEEVVDDAAKKLDEPTPTPSD